MKSTRINPLFYLVPPAQSYTVGIMMALSQTQTHVGSGRGINVGRYPQEVHPKLEEKHVKLV